MEEGRQYYGGGRDWRGTHVRRNTPEWGGRFVLGKRNVGDGRLSGRHGCQVSTWSFPVDPHPRETHRTVYSGASDGHYQP